MPSRSSNSDALSSSLGSHSGSSSNSSSGGSSSSNRSSSVINSSIASSSGIRKSKKKISMALPRRKRSTKKISMALPGRKKTKSKKLKKVSKNFLKRIHDNMLKYTSSDGKHTIRFILDNGKFTETKLPNKACSYMLSHCSKRFDEGRDKKKLRAVVRMKRKN